VGMKDGGSGVQAFRSGRRLRRSMTSAIKKSVSTLLGTTSGQPALGVHGGEMNEAVRKEKTNK